MYIYIYIKLNSEQIDFMNRKKKQGIMYCIFILFNQDWGTCSPTVQTSQTGRFYTSDPLNFLRSLFGIPETSIRFLNQNGKSFKRPGGAMTSIFCRSTPPNKVFSNQSKGHLGSRKIMFSCWSNNQ